MSERKVKFTEELQEDLTKTTDSQGQVAAELQSLEGHLGWLRVTDIFDTRIISLTTQILDTEAQGEELNRLRDRRDLLIWFKNLPKIVQQSFSANQQIDLEDFDPYEKSKSVDNGIE